MLLHVLAYLWAGPTTLVGLLFLLPALLTGGRASFIRGALEIHGGFVSWFLRKGTLLRGGASAMTLGHVILGQSADRLNHCRDHEHIHIRQCERWGPLFLPAYLLASLWMWTKGKSAYRDNPFEREAFGD